MLKTTPVVKIDVKQRKHFDCGTHALNDFFRRHSERNHLRGLGKTFVLAVADEIIGFYTVSMGNTLEFMHVPNEAEDALPHYPIPIGLIARLAVSTSKQRQGWGKWLLIDAIRRIFNAAQDVGAYAILVDAKDENAKNFYQQYGFLPFPKRPMSLYMPLSTVADLISEPSAILSI